MKFCSKCGKEIMDDAVICMNCGCAVENQPIAKNEIDEVSVGLCILSFFVPLFGVIYWPIKHKETPKKAKACGVTAIVSWAVGIVFSIIYAVALGAMFGSMY